MKYEMEYALCPLCKVDNAILVFTGTDRLCKKKGEFQVVQCRSCGLLYTNPRPTPETIGYFYPKDYSPYQGVQLPYTKIYQERDSYWVRIKNELKYQVLKKYYNYELLPSFRFNFFQMFPSVVKKAVLKICYIYFKRLYYRIPVWHEEGRALDIGCGSGGYLLLLKNLGWNVTGMDIGDNTVQQVRESGIKISIGELEKLKLNPGSFHVISMWHVLEHLHRPLETLQEIKNLLSDDGVLFIEIPNSAGFLAKIFATDWFAWDLPRHLYHFSPNTIRKFLAEAGFQKVSITHRQDSSFGKTIEYYLQKRKNYLPVHRVSYLIEENNLIKLLLKIFAKLFASIRLGDIIFMEAKK
jgi:2-polyprenyl-3-methyl-5-hydroxy-6-metoxy-1,4-benzoquinol methylase